MKKNTVITGRGIVLPQVSTVEEMINHMNNSQDISNNTKETVMGISSNIDIEGYLKNRKVKRFLSRSEKMATVALKNAMKESGLNENEMVPSDKKGIFLGNTKESGPKDDLVSVINKIYDHEKAEIVSGQFANVMSNMMSPLFVVEALPNASLHYFAEEYDIRGANSQFMNNNIASLQAFNEGYNSITAGESDVAIVGGFDSYLNDDFFNVLIDKGFVSTSKNMEEFKGAFMKGRTAPFISEGAGMLILEEEKHAIERGATIFGEVVGCKQLYLNKRNSEEKNMEQLEGAIKQFLKKVNILADDIQVIHLDASSKRVIEVEIAKVANQIFQNAFLVDSKVNFGTTIAANGCISLISLLSILEQQAIPPTILSGEIDELYVDKLVIDKPQKCKINNVMIISAGFEGEVVMTIIKRQVRRSIK